MRIKLDENIPASLARDLSELGHDVDTVRIAGTSVFRTRSRRGLVRCGARSLCFVLILLLILTLAPAPAEAGTLPSFQVIWRLSNFSNLFYTLDRVSEWDINRTGEGYREYWRKQFGLTDAEQKLLSEYASLRVRLSSGVPLEESELDTRYPVNLLPGPTSPHEFFALAFLRADNIEGAIQNLGNRITAQEGETLRKVFSHFGSSFSILWRETLYLREVQHSGEALAKSAGMADYLQTMGRFYGSEELIESPLTIELLWAPPSMGILGTTFGNKVIMVISPDETEGRHSLARIMRVIVHEFGHYFLGSLPAHQRKQISTDIVEMTGILNLRHANIVDEALQVALGDILFVKSRLSAHYFEDDNFYTYERPLDYPFAIDALARKLAPLLERSLSQPHGFYPDFLRVILTEQIRLIPPMPRHFTRVAFLYAGRRPGALFNSLFIGRSRWQQPLQPDHAIQELQAHPRRTGILVGLSSDLAALRRILEGLAEGAAPLPEVRHRGGYLLIRPRPAGGYIMVAVATDLASLRNVLIKLYLLNEFPSATVWIGE